jgi:hypothetical protein
VDTAESFFCAPFACSHALIGSSVLARRSIGTCTTSQVGKAILNMLQRGMNLSIAESIAQECCRLLDVAATCPNVWALACVVVRRQVADAEQPREERPGT